MKTNKFGEIIMEEPDLCNLIMQGRDISAMPNITADPTVDLEQLISQVQDPSSLLTWTFPETSDISVPEFDESKQAIWFMPDEYKKLDIAEHVIGLCKSDAALQRVGQELLMFQERGLFNLLRYLKYLVDMMQQNQIVWGVGRGSSVSSYVLYLLGVHRIDSLYYDLDPKEFLR